MISKVSVVDPIEFINVKEKEEERSGIRCSLVPSDINDFTWELGVKGIRGKDFLFKPGLNVVVGPNGIGKTALLSLIKKATCCNREMFSTFDRNAITKNVRRGVFSCCNVRANYDIGTLQLLRTEDIVDDERGMSFANGLIVLRTKGKSSGERSMMTIAHLVSMFKTDGRVLTGERNLDMRNFVKWVVRPIEEECGKLTDENAISFPWRYLQDYYRRNRSNDGNAVTFVMDAPDVGLDVKNLQMLYRLLLQPIVNGNDFQFIVSLDNITLIQSLMRIEGINWIELSHGYLKAIDEIGIFIPQTKKNNEEDGSSSSN